MNKNYKDNNMFFINIKSKKQILIFFLLYLSFIILYGSYQIFSINNIYLKSSFSDIAKEDIILQKDLLVMDDLKNEEEKKIFLQDIPPVYNIYDSVFYKQWNFFEKLFNFISNERPVPEILEKYINNQTDLKVHNPRLLTLLIIIADNTSLIRTFRSLLYNIYSKGVILSNLEDILTNSKKLVVVDWFRQFDTVRKEVSIDNFITLDNRDNKITEIYDQVFNGSLFDQNLLPEEKQLLLDFVKLNLKENLVYDQLQSDELKRKMLENFTPKMVELKAGTVIIKKGEIIDNEKKRILFLIQKTLKNNQIQILFSYFIALFIVGLMISFYLFNYINSFNLYKRYIVYFFILLYFSLIFYILLDLKYIKIITGFYHFPLLLFYLLIEFAYSKKDMPIIYFILLFIIFIMANYDIPLLFYGLLLYTFLSLFAVKFHSFKKAIFFKGIISIIMTLFYSLIVNIIFPKTYRTLDLLISGVLNIIVSIILYFGLIPILENIFNFPTISKLMEICDLNSQFFSEFMVKAPGTYHHSVIVANLAENAAASCDANPYITRAGGLYHDIGKIKYSKYFVENQHGENPTVEVLNPNMAVTIIKNHVKAGINEAKKLHLPKEVIDIIEQHHGTSLISFFYVKALEKKIEKIDKSNFCYNYPKPKTKEAAIIMIADSIEAVSRTIKNTDKKSLEQLVEEVINNKSKDGQLEESPLTLSDIKKIKNSMVNNLYSMFHNRIIYPDEKKIKNLEKENR